MTDQSQSRVHANGDVKGLGRQEGGAQSSSNTLTQTSSPSQVVDPGAVARAATELLATVAPGGEAAKLAAEALDAARAGDASKARELLARAKAVAEKEPLRGTSGAETTPPAPTGGEAEAPGRSGG